MRAFIAEFADRNLPVIPVFLENAAPDLELPIFLRSFTWVDFRDGKPEEAFNRLLSGIAQQKVEKTRTRMSPAARRWKRFTSWLVNRKTIAVLLAMFLLTTLYFWSLFPSQLVIGGIVSTFNSDTKKFEPTSGIDVRILGASKAESIEPTDEDGYFQLKLPLEKFSPDDEVRIGHNHPDNSVHLIDPQEPKVPSSGELVKLFFVSQQDVNDAISVRPRIASNSLLTLLSHSPIEIPEDHKSSVPTDIGALMDETAARLNVPTEAVRSAIRKVTQESVGSTDLRQEADEMILKGRFDDAGKLFDKLSNDKEHILMRLHNIESAGDQYFAAKRFAIARDRFDAAHSLLLEKEGSPASRFRLRTKAANAEHEDALRAETSRSERLSEVTKRFESLERDAQAAGEKYVWANAALLSARVRRGVLETQGEDKVAGGFQGIEATYEELGKQIDKTFDALLWAKLKHDQGGLLHIQAKRTANKEEFDKAEKCFLEAIRIWSDRGHREDAAMAENSLATLLETRAVRIGGAEARSDFRDSAALLRKALEVRTRRANEELWATSQSNLGNTLAGLAQISAPEEAKALFNEAIRAYELALEVRNARPYDGAETKLNMSNTCYQLAQLQTGETASQRLAQADELTKQVLEIYKRDSLKEDWAIVQNTRGAILDSIAMRTRADRSHEAYQKVIETFDSVKTVWTRSEKPNFWGIVQWNQSNSVRDQALRNSQDKRRAGLRETIQMLDSAHDEFKKLDAPEFAAGVMLARARTRLWLAEDAFRQGQIQPATEAIAAASTDIEGCRNQWTLSHDPQGWADLQLEEARLIYLQAMESDTSKLESLKSALTICETALGHLSQLESPHQWAAVQHVYGKVLTELAQQEGSQSSRWTGAEDAFKNALKIREPSESPFHHALTALHYSECLDSLIRITVEPELQSALQRKT